MAKLDYTAFFGKNHYINRTIPKEKWILAGMTEKSREIFESFYVSSKILYSIPVQDTNFPIIEVMISKMSSRQTSFSDILHSSIPYPVMLIQNYKDSWYKVSVVSSRPNANNNWREIVENHYDSRWTSDEGMASLLSQIANQIDFSTLKRSSLIMQINYFLHEFNSTPKDDWNYSAEDEEDDDNSVYKNNPYYLEQELDSTFNKIQELADVSYGLALDDERIMAAAIFENQCGEQLAVLDETIEEFFYAVKNYREKEHYKFSHYYEDDEEWETDSNWSMNNKLAYSAKKDEDLQIIYRIHADTIAAAVDSLVDAIRKKSSFSADSEVKKRINRLQAVVEKMSRY